MPVIALYKDRQRRLIRYVQRFLRSHAEAEDVSQEAFLRAYAAEVGGATEFSEALLYTVARNLALSELRKRTTREHLHAEEAIRLDDGDFRNDPERQAIDRNMIACVERAMSSMPPKCLEVFQLRKIDGLSHAEISERLGISVKTIERHLTKALRICRETMRLEEQGSLAGQVMHGDDHG
ncbi:RNA polymerase sigma factor [Telluria beijingensis]|uniref:RNA polymerase sigma factor n=1 Tax=Telluria beijingensis TaxID=3068633 RepID=UPI00279541A0|nr:sigma-70 family RNA polymerase sigma factor [Massilia sp. REN29]